MAATGLSSTQAPYSAGIGASEGLSIGTSATKKVGFYGATPVAQPTSAGSVTGFAAGSGTASKSDSVWAGTTGSTTYTVGDIVTILKAIGILAA